jgi:superfamily II DNA or RNA helicase
MAKRNFTASEKSAVELVSGRTGEADHITPFSKGGETTVENCQILSSKANKSKAAFDFKPRKWQSEFLKAWEQRPRGNPFTLIAIPGGGKTMAALEAARRWMVAASDRRMIIVVPTVNLLDQWKSEALKFGIELQSKEFGTDFKHGFQGAVVTYHTVANNPLVFRKMCSDTPVLVVFDEVHHCGDEAHFGRGIKEAFSLASARLLMSGTPWKSDGTPIPFVTYDGNGFAVGDFSYDYPRALTEDVVRYLVFDHAKGSLVNDCTGDQEQLSHDISDIDAAKRLRKLLSASGDYVRSVIAEAHRKLIEVRRTIPDAAGMAACIDQAHAARVAQVIREVTGRSPSLIVSDKDIENDTVTEFRRSKKEWLVSVRKVSEGTDIKRLQVLCYLTNTTSELFFRQLIGRISRVRNIEDFEAYVYLPADPRLVRCAQNIENAQVQALNEISDKDSMEQMERTDPSEVFESYSTQHDGRDVVFVGNERVPIQEAQKIEYVAESVGVPMQKVMQIMAMTQASEPVVHMPPIPEEKGLEERMDGLRKKCGQKAFHLSKILGVKVEEIHRRYKPQKQMTEGELQEKLSQLVREIGRER